MIKVMAMNIDNSKIWDIVKQYLNDTKGRNHAGMSNDVGNCPDTVNMAFNELGDPVGIMVGRPMPLIHEFRVSSPIRSREIATALFHYSMGHAFASGHSECLILIDKTNAPMLSFMQSAGAVIQSSGEDHVLTLKIR